MAQHGGAPAVLATLAMLAALTWSAALAASTTMEPGQRCYACGPQASHWFRSVRSPPCDSFQESSDFIVDCGPEYKYCAVTTSQDPYMVSRICAKEMTKGCVAKACSKTKTVFTVCTCNTTLCNNKLSAEQAKSATVTPTVLPVDEVTQTTQEPDMTSTVTSVKPEETTETQTTSNESASDESTEGPVVLEVKNSMKEAASNTTKGAKLESEIPPATSEVHQEHIAMMPLPAALGQEDKKSQHGAPVDDEEDTSEGSGSGSHKIHNAPTTLSPTTEHPTTTTESPKNIAPSSYTHFALSFAIWTTAALKIFV